MEKEKEKENEENEKNEKNEKNEEKIVSKYDATQLNIIRETIEQMTKFNQIAVLRILKNTSGVIINENKYGIHVNLTELSDTLINELIVYINYVNEQEIELNNIEQKKTYYKSIYFVKDNKDNMININNKYVTQS